MDSKRELKTAMVAKGFNQNELAKQLCINKATLSKKINGRSQWTLTEMKQLKEILALSEKQFKNIFFANDVSYKKQG